MPCGGKCSAGREAPSKPRFHTVHTDPAKDLAAFHSILLKDRWFADLPAQMQDKLFRHARVCHMQADQPLFLRGDVFNGLYCVLEGLVRISCTAPDGSAGILTFVEPSQWFGEVGLFDRRTRSHDANAEGPASVLHIPASVLDKLVAENPGLWQHFGMLLAQKMRSVFVGLEAFALLPAQSWVARRLLMLARQHWTVATANKQNIVPVSQDHLALMLSMTRQTTNRILQKLEQDGVLRCGYRHIEILDWDGLWQAADLHRPHLPV